MKHPFDYQTPTAEHIEAIKNVREAFKTAYEVLLENVRSASAQRTLAIRKLEEASMWANKAIVFGGENYL